MKRTITIMCFILLVAAFGSLAALAGPGGQSQKGGLPALEKRVAKVEGQVANLISQAGSLQKNIITITKMVLNLEGRNNWAVVDSSANVVRHSGISNVTATKRGTGTYEVTFARRDVTRCAYIATIGDVGQASATPGFVTVSGGVLHNLTDVQVQTFDQTGVAADSGFDLYVSCP